MWDDQQNMKLTLIALSALLTLAAALPHGDCPPGCCGSGEFFIVPSAVPREAAGPLCAANGGELAKLTSADMEKASVVAFQCSGPNSESWIEEYEVKPPGGACLVISTGSAAPGAAINVPNDCQKHLFPLCRVSKCMDKGCLKPCEGKDCLKPCDCKECRKPCGEDCRKPCDCKECPKPCDRKGCGCDEHRGCDHHRVWDEHGDQDGRGDDGPDGDDGPRGRGGPGRDDDDEDHYERDHLLLRDNPVADWVRDDKCSCPQCTGKPGCLCPGCSRPSPIDMVARVKGGKGKTAQGQTEQNKTGQSQTVQNQANQANQASQANQTNQANQASQTNQKQTNQSQTAQGQAGQAKKVASISAKTRQIIAAPAAA
ncbi:hypothetical protein PSACC_03634 [Paramicrosporidium saccamoebae]|uniref:Uncharacterized protein n=1 Tax=Paramicrosporidium saccamoebae TaxID=1246581 RepID=A0A2H9TGA4_9FUNG|nr:hypothetical protein PSACC_03634 [Paramicrosporidium saccamoebae]